MIDIEVGDIRHHEYYVYRTSIGTLRLSCHDYSRLMKDLGVIDSLDSKISLAITNIFR